MPHQIHFEAWARTLTKPLANVPAYVKSYQAYCASTKSIHGIKTEDSATFGILRDALKRLTNQVKEDPELNPEEFHKVVTKFRDFYKTGKKYDGVDKEWLEATLKKHKVDLDDLIHQYFEFKMATKTLNAIKQALKYYFLAAYDLRSDTNLLFVGFGAKEDFASAQRLFIRAIVNGKLLSYTDEAVAVHPDGINSRILYAAQYDAMKMFVEGIRPQLYDTLSTITHNVLNEQLQPDPTKPDDKTTALVHDLSTKINNALGEATDDMYVQPAFNAIMNMNTDQLASAARGLVLLQTAAASIGTSTPTVGGQVEVVVVSSKDGLSNR